MLIKLVQLLKSTSVSPLQPSNADHPILVKLVHLLKSTSVSPLQSLNASSLILVKLDGKVILVSPLQPRNAESPILVTPSGTTKFVNSSPFTINVCESSSIQYAPKSIDSHWSIVPLYSSVSIPLQFWNACSPILVKLDGKVILVSPLQ